MDNFTMDKLLVVISLVLVHVDGYCRFPYQLQGAWYQKGLGDIVISEQNMSKKGYCVENLDYSFLLENRELGCFQCIKIIERHQNVIQYRESYCSGRDSIVSICNQISDMALLNTMVRERSVPVRCPFQDAYHFQYNNNTGGFCRDPTSYVKQCAGDSKFRFHFKHCPVAAYTYNQDLDYECLATWQDGSDMYMYGRFNGPGFSESKEARYRCFMYQVLGTVVYLAMSGDTTCRGLRSARDGSLVMELTKDVFGWPEPLCMFPSWVTRYTWRDLSGDHMYLSNTKGSVITVRYRMADGSSEVRMAFRCQKIVDSEKNKKRFTALSFTSDDCLPRYQCIMFQKRRDGVTELHQGRWKEYETDECTRRDFDRATRYLLLPAPTTVTSCPFPGLHKMEDVDDPRCGGYIQSGCNGSSTMEINSPCSSQPKVMLECLKTWGNADKKTFIIASRAKDRQGVANCFSMKMKGSMLQFSTDRNCNMGTTDIFNIAVKYLVRPKPERCILHSAKPKLKPETESRHNSERDTADKKADADKQEGQYRHVKPQDHTPQSQIVSKTTTSSARPFMSSAQGGLSVRLRSLLSFSELLASCSIYTSELLLPVFFCDIIYVLKQCYAYALTLK